MPRRNGLPTLADLEAQLHPLWDFWSLYNKEKACRDCCPENFRLGRQKVNTSDCPDEVKKMYKTGRGVYLIADQNWTEGGVQLRQGDMRVPLGKVIYVGQAGAIGQGSNFHERVYKHALVAIGLHEGNANEQPVGGLQLGNRKGIKDSRYWQAYRGKRPSDFQQQIFPLDSWFVLMITMPSTTPKQKQNIKRLEDYLMLGASALRDTDIRQFSARFSKTLPPCNMQFGLNCLSEVFITGWK
jgi:hypothetical protein